MGLVSPPILRLSARGIGSLLGSSSFGMVKIASVSATEVVASEPRGAGTLGVIDRLRLILLLDCGLLVKISCRVLAN